MTLTSTIVAAVLVFVEGSASSRESGPGCTDADNHCNAKRFERLAKAATKPQHRAAYLHGAHVSYVALFVQTGKDRHLCAARRTFDQSLAIKGLLPQQRVSFEVARAELEAHERRSGVECNKTVTRSPSEKPKVAEGATPATPAATKPAIDRDASLVPAASGPPFAPRVRAPSPSPDVIVLLPVTRRPNVPPAVSPEQPRGTARSFTTPAPDGRRLVISGGVTLGVGLALAGVAGYMGSRTVGAYREALALGGMVDGFADDPQLAEDARLTREYERLGTQTLVLALAGGTTVVVAAVLLGVGGRRLARVVSRTALAPAPGGLVFRARF